MFGREEKTGGESLVFLCFFSFLAVGGCWMMDASWVWLVVVGELCVFLCVLDSDRLLAFSSSYI